MLFIVHSNYYMPIIGIMHMTIVQFAQSGKFSKQCPNMTWLDKLGLER